MREEIKKRIIKNMVKDGFNFGKNVFELTIKEKGYFKKLAISLKYRKPKNSYVDTGSAFYLHLQKIYYKMK